MAPPPGSGPVPADVTALQTDEAPSPSVLPTAHGPASIVYTDVMSSFYTDTSPCDTATPPCTGAAPVSAIRQGDDVRSPRQRRKPNPKALSAAEPSRAPVMDTQTGQQSPIQQQKRCRSSSPPAQQPLRRSIRRRTLHKVFDPSDPAAMLDMCSSRARARITHSPVFHLTMGEPGHDVECCLCVCRRFVLCVCAGTSLKSLAGSSDDARANQSGSGSAAVLAYGGLLSGMMRAGTSR